jgi:serine/threonine-protein kinase
VTGVRPTPHKPESYLGKTVAGRYEIKSVLGAGGMGAVFVAEQKPLGREVALKIIKQSLSDDPDAVARFEQEAKTVSTLQHPNLITVYDYGHDEDGTLFIAMELLKGRSVRDVLVEERHLEWSRTLPIVSDVCRALAEAHRAGIIHRDLKPDNIMLLDKSGEREFAKVLDFGVAKLLDTEGKGLTTTGVLVGTPGYISPEQMNGTTDDARSDLYALGVVWYEMLSGLSPFHDTTPMRLAVKHMTEAPPDLQSRVPGFGIPDEVATIVMRLLAKRPAERAESSQALLAEIDALWSRSNSLPPSATTETALASPSKLAPPPNASPSSRSSPQVAPPAPAPAPTPPTAHPPIAAAPTPTPVTPVPSNPQGIAPQVTQPQPIPVKGAGCGLPLIVTLVVVTLLLGTCGFAIVVGAMNAENNRTVTYEGDGRTVTLKSTGADVATEVSPPTPPAPAEPVNLKRVVRKLKKRPAQKAAREFLNAVDKGDAQRARRVLERAERLDPASMAELEEKFLPALLEYVAREPSRAKERARWAARSATLAAVMGQELGADLDPEALGALLRAMAEGQP